MIFLTILSGRNLDFCPPMRIANATAPLHRYVWTGLLLLGSLPAALAQYAITQKGSSPTILLGSLTEGMKQGLEQAWDSTWVVRDWRKGNTGKWNVVVQSAPVLKNSWSRLAIPVHHTVQKGQNLNTIQSKYNPQMSIAQLKRINKLRTETVAAGRKIIVGYVAMEPVQGSYTAAADDDVLIAEKAPVDKPAVNLYEGVGFFAIEWKTTGNEQSTQARVGCFKAETGWQDGKYYMLHNHIPAGKVVKLTNPANGITIFAKVASPLPNLKANQGINARICTAAGAQLGISETEIMELVLSY